LKHGHPVGLLSKVQSLADMGGQAMAFGELPILGDDQVESAGTVRFEKPASVRVAFFTEEVAVQRPLNCVLAPAKERPRNLYQIIGVGVGGRR
jgi:hypothetical protein